MSNRDKSGRYARHSTFRSMVIGIGVILLLTSAAFVAYDKGLLTAVETVEKQVTVTEEVHPDWATDQDAVEAAQAVIRKKELQAQEAELKAQMEALQAELDAVQKELGTF